jgi:glycosyltransferase involved in cell wall biosynthesis
LVHDWLNGMRGGEKCLARLCERWPDAPLFTLFHDRGRVSPTIEQRPVATSLLQYVPGKSSFYRYLLPVMPLAARWKLPPCDLVISLSHCVAKAANPPPGVPHVCYCFTPMRYAWHMREAYFSRFKGPKGWIIRRLLSRLRRWDRATAERVTHFVAISRTIQSRIRDCYGRDSKVIYPPVDTDYYCPSDARREEYYLVVSAFAPYKRIDLAVEACSRLGRQLVVIGTGQDDGHLRSKAGKHVTFLGWQSDESIREHFRRCRALLFPGEEDFGIVPVESQACGTPVIAFGRGGAAETVVPLDLSDGPTGVFFHEQTVDALVDAILQFETRSGEFDPAAVRRQAVQFHPRRFDDEFERFLDSILGTHSTRRRAA